jgi:hypothetical protein
MRRQLRSEDTEFLEGLWIVGEKVMHKYHEKSAKAETIQFRVIESRGCSQSLPLRGPQFNRRPLRRLIMAEIPRRVSLWLRNLNRTSRFGPRCKEITIELSQSAHPFVYLVLLGLFHTPSSESF